MDSPSTLVRNLYANPVQVNAAGGIPQGFGYSEMPKVAQQNLISAQMCSEMLAPELANSEVRALYINLNLLVDSDNPRSKKGSE